MLWFAMMLMPTGPPALKLTALADVNGNSDEDKMSIAKFLTVGRLFVIRKWSTVGADRTHRLRMLLVPWSPSLLWEV